MRCHFPDRELSKVDKLIECVLGGSVDGGHRAVLFDRFRGVLDETAGEGTHVLIPWLQKPYIFDVRTRPRSITSVTGTKGKAAA